MFCLFRTSPCADIGHHVRKVTMYQFPYVYVVRPSLLHIVPRGSLLPCLLPPPYCYAVAHGQWLIRATRQETALFVVPYNSCIRDEIFHFYSISISKKDGTTFLVWTFQQCSKLRFWFVCTSSAYDLKLCAREVPSELLNVFVS